MRGASLCVGRGLPTLVLGFVLLASACSTAERPDPVVARPEQLSLPPLRFEPPDPASMRYELANGVPVFALEDHELPLVTVRLLFRGGSFLEPVGKEGLADLTAVAWSAGGAGGRSADELDDELDRLAADLSVEIGEENGSVTLDVLSRHLEPSTLLLLDVFGDPAFEEDRLAQARLDLLQSLRARDDDPAEVEEREWSRLLYGQHSWRNRLPTPASVEAITAEDCRLLVAPLVRAGNVVVAVAGDFDPAVLRPLLERTLGTLPPFDRQLPPVPQPAESPVPGVWILDRPGMVQSRVRLGQLGLRQGERDELALLALNEILGGGFTSRLVRRIRSEEGLAYDVSSLATLPATFPGTFDVAFQTRSATCAWAVSLALEEVRNLRAGEISADELTQAQSALLARGLELFGSAEATVTTLARDEVDRRPADFWKSYAERVRTLTPADLHDAADRYLDPQRMVILVVGDRAAVERGDQEHPVALGAFGPVRSLPSRDPLTLQPLDEQGLRSRTVPRFKQRNHLLVPIARGAGFRSQAVDGRSRVRCDGAHSRLPGRDPH